MEGYIGHYGEVIIPQSEKAEYLSDVVTLLEAGGMLNLRKVNEFGADLELLRPIDTDGNKICFNYSYIEDSDCDISITDLTTAGISVKDTKSTVIRRVFEAICILGEFYSKSFALTNIDGEIKDERDSIGWLNYVLDEQYTNKRFDSLWNVYELLHKENALKNNHFIELLSTDSFLEQICIMDILTYAYVNRTDNYIWREILPEIKEMKNKEDGNLYPGVCFLKLIEIIDQMKEKGYSYDEMKDTLFMNIEVSKFEGDEELDRFYFYSKLISKTGCLKILCEQYDKPFWEEYYDSKSQINKEKDIFTRAFEDKREEKIIEKKTTGSFLNIPDDELVYHWNNGKEIHLSKSFKKWCISLRKDFNEINKEAYELQNKEHFAMKLINLLKLADSKYGKIYAFEDMFYEFVENLDKEEYQSAVRLLENLIENNEKKDRTLVKSYLAILANKQFRDELLGF